ncbi:unnamed protein product [Adineta ricciae]|uniref:G-protein coupled receptors family 1 profile domain-containing protein n=1 Tax=Adineta ricciae TaxID=249248 RepID=A0A815B9X0_ADIRI|nr:unnamed protein product [Adineta ricciae]CAF1266437.1 unnamed protein product [Adineta ricciae]
MNKTDNNLMFSMHINVNHILTFLFVIIAIVGILGNLLVIISVEFDARMRRSLTNQLIVRVASCDFLILVFNIPDLVQFVSSPDGNWVLNQLACKLIRTTLVLAQYASVLTMCALTIERFIGIVYPLRSKLLREKEHVIAITFVVWIISFVCASPNLIYLRILTDPVSSRRACVLQYSKMNIMENRRSYIIHKALESVLFYFLPLLLQVFCYARIARQLCHVDDALQASFRTVVKTSTQRTQVDIDDEDDFTDNDENSGTKYTRVDSISHSPIRRSKQSSQPCVTYVLQRQPFKTSYPIHRTTVTYDALKSRRNVIKMLFVVVLIYFISFSPQVLVFILFETTLVRHAPQFIQTPYFIAFTMLLVTLSSASNPIVYAIFCSKFRQSFAKLLRKIFCFCRKEFDYRSNHRAVSLQQIQSSNLRVNDRVHTSERRHSPTNGKQRTST